MVQKLPLRAMFSQPICPYVRSTMRNMWEAEVSKPNPSFIALDVHWNSMIDFDSMSQEEFMVSLYLPVSHDIGLTNRELFVSFLVDIQEKLVLSSVTLSLALNYVDRQAA